MEIRALDIAGAYEFTPPVFTDERGLFTSPYREEAFHRALGRPLFPVRQVSHNLSANGVLRGVHYTATPPGCAKYVCCQHGTVRDFLVDLRVGSPTFGRYEVTELGGGTGRALYVPVGVGHAFLSTAEVSLVTYLLSAEYQPANELALDPLDPAIGLPVPVTEPAHPPVRSRRDREAPSLDEAADRGLLPAYADCLAAEGLL
ncbi:dTDP-4-dehydrorhamnose 3,5-epimerase family protein [Streptomyces sp. DSM 44915]|uniref:dTDP-4-dehydrorhamnose 3,5-epimerase family protein n=1 Tax=Streptomyces chisholmiae TaxID=3075540 RepID=A0ABU2JMB1_9ACTN|nr:dTDP-4-dehydrorhamnose 3,5-epimerase family protein [Streptomyces sp. DSM 44915]MDT0266126.1 dTDP-4-dehydrorhamnose 3,5-epimerase family protein [Streptomyces sp. DSM 44915]